MRHWNGGRDPVGARRPDHPGADADTDPADTATAAPGTGARDSGEPLVDGWKRHGQTYQLGESFGQGGYGTYGAERRNGARATTHANGPGESEPADALPSTPVPDDVASPDSKLPAAGGRSLRIAALMTSRPRCASVDASLAEVAGIMKAADCGIVPIVDERERLIGVVTDRDIVVRACAAGKSPKETRVVDVMSREVATALPDEDVRAVIARMAQRQVRRIPVVDGEGRVVGLVALADIANRARRSRDRDDPRGATTRQELEYDLAQALEEISSRRPS